MSDSVRPIAPTGDWRAGERWWWRDGWGWGWPRFRHRSRERSEGTLWRAEAWAEAMAVADPEELGSAPSREELELTVGRSEEQRVRDRSRQLKLSFSDRS